MPHDFAADNARALVEEIKRAAGEYGRWALEARKKYVDLRLRQDPAIRKLYLRAADRIAAELRAMGALTVGGMLRKRHLEELEASLRREADRLTGELTDEIKRAVDEAVSASAGFSQAVTLSLAAKAALDTGRIREVFAQVNRQAVEAIWARSRDGLRLSDRIWQKGETARNAIRDIIQDAVATGQDAVKTARLLEQYVRTDARTLAKNYPNMMKRMAGRIPGDLSYEALRLARTETTAAFGEGTVAAAQVSPSYRGMKWVLSKAHPAPDICDLLAAADSGLGPGVYPPGEEPMYPAHPNELCTLVPVHEQPEEFVQRLKRWRESPDLEPDLEKWYNQVYKGDQKIFIPNSLSAATKRIYVKNAIGIGRKEFLKEGTYITGVKVIASGRDVRIVEKLIQKYPLQNGKFTKVEDWSKMRGTATVTDGKNEYTAEIHWYQAKDIGKVEWKVKRRLER